MFEWATGLVGEAGYSGIFFAMILENIFPPIPSEAIMIFSGGSGYPLVLVVLVGALGSVVGLLPWYVGARFYGYERMRVFVIHNQRLLTISKKNFDRADKWFERYGGRAVLVARFLPAIRTFIAIPASVMRMNFWRFCFFAFVGSILWDGAFAYIGYRVGQSPPHIEDYVNIITYVLGALIVLWYVYRVIIFKKDGEKIA